MKKQILTGVCTLLVAACSTPTPPPAQSPAPVAAAPAPPTAPLPTPIPTAQAAPIVKPESPQESFERARAALTGGSVYFDFDKAIVRSDFEPLIAQHAHLLSSFPHDQLTLEGSCDERGSREYNLALGQRRADVVRQRLVLLGAPASRIETISFGKEKPRAQCHEEKCWSENRRADFVDVWK